MSYRHGKRWVVIILAPGESQSPRKFRCVYMHCGRTMMTINRDVACILENNKGVHWSDLPADITVIEHKCRGCDYYYKIYTPATEQAGKEFETMLQRPLHV